MTDQANLVMEIPDCKPPMPQLWIISYQYKGPGPSSGVWRVSGPYISEETAKERAEQGVIGSWGIRKMIWRLA